MADLPSGSRGIIDLSVQGIFVTGTDTGIGKTVVCAALMCALRRTADVCYWKPIQTGTEADNDTDTVKNLADCSGAEILDRGIRLEKPLSPHLSARLANVGITVEQTLRLWERDPKKFWIVEGAGGVLVPLNDDELMIDLIKAVGFPALIVARSTLGTINHTLLTIEALRKRDVEVAGVVLNGETNSENRKAIEKYGDVPILFQLSPFRKLESLCEWSGGIDPGLFQHVFRRNAGGG